jgi:hypothetical protein
MSEVLLEQFVVAYFIEYLTSITINKKRNITVSALLIPFTDIVGRY